MALELVSLDTAKELAHQYGYWTIFFGIMLENAGVPIPGETITLVGGFLAGEGELGYRGVLASAIAGAVLGDNVGYWLGVLGGWKLLVRIGTLFRVSEERLLDAKKRFSENAEKAVFLGRFVALLRIFAGPLAGIAGMPYPSFFLCNLAGAITWGSIMVTLSYFVGQLIPLEQLVAGVTQFGIFALLAFVAAIALPIWLERRMAQQPSED
ncbi:DedA family protein [Vacuolonema iberomarrocanum]|uniref:DedA family protein n=1 Tax=Vacuolonema iberomarrocanum TaxID=3454632 RepID=UPI0019EBD291|nr:DedA family protein [filamentous cyanobacterium LEGE 07170]